MSKRLKHPKATFLLIGLLAGLIFLLACFPSSSLPKIFSPLSVVMTPVQSFVARWGQGLENFRQNLQEGEKLNQDILALQEKNAQLEQENHQLRADLEQYKELRDGLQIKERYRGSTVMHANVLSLALDRWFDTLRIDRGQQDRLSQQDSSRATVVDVNMHLVGRVLLTDLASSKVLPIVAEGSSVSARVNRIDGSAVRVQGSWMLKKDGLCLVDRIPSTARLEVGDELLTSGEGGLYPAGIPIGVIQAVHHDYSGVWASLKPYVDFSDLRNVFVVVPNADREGRAATEQEMAP